MLLDYSNAVITAKAQRIQLLQRTRLPSLINLLGCIICCSSDLNERMYGCSRNIKARHGRYRALFEIPRKGYVDWVTATMSLAVPRDG